jgi:uncharacterized protein (TIGR02453 family)
MAHLSQEFVLFYQDLAQNNNRDWFHENKKRYEAAVKEPFKTFVSALIEAFKEIEPEVTMTARDAIFRINRDIRFSKDKTPYKMHASAAVSTTMKKDFSNPNGLYFEITPEIIRQYGGAYGPDKNALHAIRTAMVANPKEFEQIISEKSFVKTFGAIRGDKNKRIPKEFKAANETQPLIANKQFYYFTEMDIENIDRDDLIDRFIKNYQIAKPLNQFLDKAMNG